MTKPIFEMPVAEVCEEYDVLPHLARQKIRNSAIEAFKRDPNDPRLEPHKKWLEREIEALARAAGRWEPIKKKFRHLPEKAIEQSLPNYIPSKKRTNGEVRQGILVSDAQRNLLWQFFEKATKDGDAICPIPTKVFADIFRLTKSQGHSKLCEWIDKWNATHKRKIKRPVSPRKSTKADRMLSW